MRPEPRAIGKPAGGSAAGRGGKAAGLGGLARLARDRAASLGMVHLRPEWDLPPTEQVELECLAAGGGGAETRAAEVAKGRQDLATRRRYFRIWTEWLGLTRLWSVPAVFCSLQLACLARTGDSLFGHLTGGAVESLLLATTGRSMRWHLFGGIAMWFLGAVQFLVKPFRHGRLAIVHRALGRALLFLWACIVGPTAVHLGLFCGTGPARAHFWMTVFMVVSLDTAFHAYYFFWRGLLVIRRRASADSVELHRKAMSAGMFFTMTILWQRPLQAVAFIGLRRAMLRAAAALQLEWPRRVALRLLDHHVGLAVSTAIIGVPSMLLDGPRSWLARSMLDLSEEQVEELYGSREPGTMEVLLWRLRLPVYLVLRALITDFWTSNPDP